MPTIPRTLTGKIEFFERHLPVWSDDPAAIGLSAAQVADLAALTAEARTRYDRARAARLVARAETGLQHEAIGAMMKLGTALVATIRAFADATDDEAGVMSRANLPPVDAPSPAPPPEPAANLTSELRNSGAIRLAWHGTVANGTFYTIWRRLEGEQGFTLLGSVSALAFTDETIPAGTPEATYQLRTHRDEFTSAPSVAISVRLGVRSAVGGAAVGVGAVGVGAGTGSPGTTAPRRAAA